ncbi:MAG: hypothetical protein VW683_10690 [Betaproteobacteria bacterium]
MYLRQSNKWKQFLLQEAIEQTGLPLEVVAMIRDLSNELGSVPEKILTSLGTMARSYSYATPLIIDWMSPSDGDNKFRSNPAISDLQAILYDRRKPRSERTAEDEALRKEMDEEFIHPLVAGTTGNNPDNPRLANILDTNRYRKRYVKKLKKAGLTEKAEASDKVFVDAMVKWAEKFVMPELEPIIKAVVEDPDDYESILKFVSLIPDKRKLITARIKAKRLLEREPEDPQNVVRKFDNGYYWYDIRSDACTIEGQKMGHCGKGLAGGNLYSLRSPSGTRKDPDPHVTIEMTADGIIHQIKGKGNDAPVKKYWPYISSFIKNVLTDEGKPVSGYKEDKTLRGFSEMYDYLQEQNPLALKEDFAATANRYKEYLAEYADGLFSNYGMLASSPSPLDKVNAKNISFSSTPPQVYSNTYTVRFTIDYKLKYKAKLPNYFNFRDISSRGRARRREELDKIQDHIKNEIFPKYFSTGTSDSILPAPSRPKAKYNEGSLSDIYDLHYDLKWEWNIPTGYPGPPESTKKLKDAAKEIKAVLKYLVGIEVDLRSGGKLDPDQKKFLQGKFNKEGGMAKMDIAGFEMEVEKYFDSLGFQPSDDEEMLQESITFDRWAKIIK